MPLADLLRAIDDGRAADLMYPVDEAIVDFDAIAVGSEGERRITTGSPHRPARVLREPCGAALCRVYSEDGAVVGIARFEPTAGEWRPVKSLVSR